MRDVTDYFPPIACAILALIFFSMWLSNSGTFSGRQILMRKWILSHGMPGTAVVIRKDSTINAARKMPMLASRGRFGRGSSNVYFLYLERRGENQTVFKSTLRTTQKGWNAVHEGDAVAVHYLAEHPERMAMDNDYGYTTRLGWFLVALVITGSFFFAFGTFVLWP